MSHSETVTLYNYWDRGIDKMPTVLKHIYKHNREMAAKHDFGFVLITKDNVSDYIRVPGAFGDLSPVHQSDVVRFLVLHESGGIWLDSDVIVIGDLRSAYEHFLKTQKDMLVDVEFDMNDYHHVLSGPMVIFSMARAKRARFVETFKIGSASIFSRRNTVCSRFCRDYILDKLTAIRAFEWPELGPDNVTTLYKAHPSRVLLNRAATVKNGSNFNNWVDCRDPSNSNWLKESEAAARARALKIASTCTYVITWNLHNNFGSAAEALAAIFHNRKSVFHHLTMTALQPM